MISALKSKSNLRQCFIILALVPTLFSCQDSDEESPEPILSEQQIESNKLEEKLLQVSSSGDMSAFILPDSDDFEAIPQDPSNSITAEKVALGKLLFHETGLSTEGVHEDLAGTWSCASCHHAEAGFKSGIKQGIGEGGSGFANKGSSRSLAAGFSADSEDPAFVPDVQPVTSPTALNSAFQDVMLWNGQFGNSINGIVNAFVPESRLSTSGTPKAENTRQLSGLETQAIAGLTVHRMKVTDDSVLQTNQEYVDLFEQAYPQGSDDVLRDAGFAIAAYERTLLANESPFQKWLRGDKEAMTVDQLKGANLFFGEANCYSCHTGPALSSKVNAPEQDVFFAIAFNDFDTEDSSVTGMVDQATALGRGGFTGDEANNYQFKVPQLYNLKDSNVFGHGGSFSSVEDVVRYKNLAVPQNNTVPLDLIDHRFYPLNLSEEGILALTVFLEDALYDANLNRFVPERLPTGNCIAVADEQSIIDKGCAN